MGEGGPMSESRGQSRKISLRAHRPVLFDHLVGGGRSKRNLVWRFLTWRYDPQPSSLFYILDQRSPLSRSSQEASLRLLSAIVATPFAIHTLAFCPLLFAIGPSRIRTLRTTELFRP